MKTSVFLAFFSLAFSASAAWACPNPNANSLGQFTADRQTLSRGISFGVTGGGTNNAGVCGIDPSATGGFFLTPAHMNLTLENVAPRALRISTTTDGTCDPLLLVRGVNQEWYWDDNGRGREAEVTATATSNGVVSIWVGSADGAPCETTVVVRLIRVSANLASGGGQGNGGESDEDAGGGDGGTNGDDVDDNRGDDQPSNRR